MCGHNNLCNPCNKCTQTCGTNAQACLTQNALLEAFKCLTSGIMTNTIPDGYLLAWDSTSLCFEAVPAGPGSGGCGCTYSVGGVPLLTGDNINFLPCGPITPTVVNSAAGVDVSFCLTPGTNGQVLTTIGTSVIWATPSGGGSPCPCNPITIGGVTPPNGNVLNFVAGTGIDIVTTSSGTTTNITISTEPVTAVDTDTFMVNGSAIDVVGCGVFKPQITTTATGIEIDICPTPGTNGQVLTQTASGPVWTTLASGTANTTLVDNDTININGTNIDFVGCGIFDPQITTVGTGIQVDLCPSGGTNGQVIVQTATGPQWANPCTLCQPITVGTAPACNTLVISAHTGINTAGVAVNIPASTFTIPAGLSGTVYVMYDVATSTVIANTTGFLTDGTVIPLGVATVPTAGGCITAWTAFIDMPEAYQAGGGGGSFTVVGDAPGTGTVNGGGTVDFQSSDGTIFSTISQSGSTTIVNLSAAQRVPTSKCYNSCGLLTLTFPAWNGLPAKTITSTSPTDGVVEIYDGAILLATKTADCNTSCETIVYEPVMQTSYAWLYPYI